MPQLHFYVPEETAEQIRQEARAAGMSVSKFIAQVVNRELHPDWPPGFFEKVVGGWQGEPLQRAEQGDFDLRETPFLKEADVSS